MTPIEALEAAREEGVLPPGSRVLVACSGGLDSMALAHAMVGLGHWEVCAATVDHGWQPASAATARWTVEQLAGLGIGCHLLTVGEAPSSGGGREALARTARYALLNQCADRIGATHVVTAHTAEDQVETLLMRLADGAGLAGLRGIAARRARLVRPWLQVSRAAIAGYAEGVGLLWRDDPTNADQSLRRNAVRVQAMPGLLAALGPGWPEAASRSAGHLADAWAAQDWLLDRFFTTSTLPVSNGLTLDRRALSEAPLAVRRVVLRAALDRAAREAGREPMRNVRVHVEHLAERVARPGTGDWSLPAGLSAWFAGHALYLGVLPQPAPSPAPLLVEGAGRFGWGPWTVSIEALPAPPEEQGASLVAHAKAPWPWVVRAASSGERFRPLGAPGHKRLSRLWIDAHVPRHLRPGLPVIEVGGRLAWVGGLRAAEWTRAGRGEAVWGIALRPTRPS